MKRDISRFDFFVFPEIAPKVSWVIRKTFLRDCGKKRKGRNLTVIIYESFGIFNKSNE